MKEARKMTLAVKPIPEGYHSITPFLTVRGADRAIDFYRFGHKWDLATHREDVPPEEMKRRGAEFFKKMEGGKS